MGENNTTETVLFEIKINSEQYRSEQKLIRDSLGQLVLDIEKTKQAQQALDAARKAGKVSDADYAQQAVKLRETLKGQQTDQRELTKALETSQRVMGAGAGSIDQLRARLSELTVAWNALSAAERDNSEEGQRLQAEARAVSDELKKQEALIGDNRRNVGNYASSFKQGLVGIVAELAKVTAAQKLVDAGSEQSAKLNQQRIGFQTAAQRQLAQQGVTDFAQAQATIEQYAQALAPAAENLVRLQQEQQQVGQTTGETSEQYQQLGFRIAGAEKALTDLVRAQQAAEQASRAGGAAAQGQAGAVEVAANSLAGLRQQLAELKQQREVLDPTTQEAQELNGQILELDTRIQQAAGKIDEFGERVQKNIKKENFDTVSDAIQGLSGATALATLVFGDNENAAKAQAKALQLMAVAQNARAIAIGLDSAKDAVSIVLKHARNLLLKEEATVTAAAAVSTEAHAAVAGADAVAVAAQAAAAELNAGAQAAGTEAVVANTVATEAQAVATTGASVASRVAAVAVRALGVAMSLTPVGILLTGLAALAAGLFAYSNASDKTKERVNKLVEALFRYTTPVGLAVTASQKLYERFELVRKVCEPLLDGFKQVAATVAASARAAGEWAGILDTAQEKALKLAQAQVELAQRQRAQFEAELKSLELYGKSADAIALRKQQQLAQEVDQRVRANQLFRSLHQEELRRIDEELRSGKQLSDLSKDDQKLYEEREKGAKAVRDLNNETVALTNERIERERAARQQEAKDVQTNAQRAVQNLQARIEQQDALENAAAKRRMERLDVALGRVRKDSVDEVVLQQQKVQAQAELEIRQLQQALVERTRLRNAGYAQEKAALASQEKEALQQFGLTEQQKKEITDDYAQQRVELEKKYSLTAARQALAEIPIIQAQAAAQRLALSADYLRKEKAAELALAVELTKEQVAQAQEGSLRRHELDVQLIDQEEQLALAGLDRQAISEAEYQARITAIHADATAKRKALGEEETQRVISLLQEQQHAAELSQQLLLAGKTDAQQAEVKASKAYKNELLRAEYESYAAQTLATKEGTQARENVEKQHAINLKNIEAETSQAQVQLVAQKYEQMAQLASQAIAAISTIESAELQNRLNRLQQEESAATTSAARKAVLAKQEERISQQLHEKQKKYAIAQAVIDGGSAVMRILADTPKFDFGVTTALQIALAIATTAAQIRSISAQKFSTGGLVFGPGGPKDDLVPAWLSNGEAVMSAGAVRKHGQLLSRLNVDGGGRPFYTDPTPLATWARYAEGGLVRADSLPQVRTGGVVVPASQIDYELLTDMMAAKLAPVFVAGAQALPAQQLNLTELQQRQDAQRRTQQQTDI